MDEKRLADQQRKHEDTVKELKKDCFDTPKLRDWCFAQDNGANPQMKHARFYADNFDTMLLDNIGYLLWGSVGTGQELFRRLYRQRPDGERNPCPHDELCRRPQ